MRASSVEQVIIETLSHELAHLTSLQVYEEIRGRLPALNQSTVYRALERLVKQGKVSVSDMGSGSAVYELLQSEPHHHLVCQSCGQVQTIDNELVGQFFSQVSDNFHFKLSTNHLVLFGKCANCRQLDP
jgi:Fur family ferric uptake transcriptional regulator